MLDIILVIAIVALFSFLVFFTNWSDKQVSK